MINALISAAFAALITGYAALPLSYCVIAAILAAVLSILIDRSK